MSPRRLVLSLLSVSLLAFPAVTSAASVVHLSFAPHGRRSFSPHYWKAPVETLQAQAPGRINIRRLTIVVEGRNRYGRSTGAEKVGDIIKEIDIQNTESKRSIAAIPTTSGNGLQRYRLDDFLGADGGKASQWTLRMTVEDHRLIDQLRVTVCGAEKTSPPSCGSDSEAKAEDLFSGEKIAVEPAAGFTGSWATFRVPRTRNR